MDDLRSFEVIKAFCCEVCLEDVLIGLDRLWNIQRFLRLFLSVLLSVHRFHELRASINWLVLHLSNGFASAVHDLQDEYGIVVNDIEEERRVDKERQGYLDGYCIVILGNLRTEDSSACENKFHHNKGDEVEDPSEVVVKKEQFCVVEHLSGLNEALMLRLYYVFASGKVLGKDLAVVLCFFTLLSQVRILYPNHLWLLGIIHTVEFNFFEHDFGFVVLSLEAGDEAELVGLGNGDDHDVDKRDEDDGNGREELVVGVLCDDDDGGDEGDEGHYEVGVLEGYEGVVGVELAHVFSQLAEITAAFRVFVLDQSGEVDYNSSRDADAHRVAPEIRGVDCVKGFKDDAD